MSQVFHDIEKKIINSLKENSIQTPETLENSTQLSPDQIRRGIEWLKLNSFEKGLPERRLLNLVKNGPKKLSEIQKELGFIFGPAIGLCRKNNWIETSSDQIILKTLPSELPGEKSLQLIGNNKLPKEQIDKTDLSELSKRPDFIIEDIIKNKKISLTDSAKSLDVSNISGAIDVEAEVPEIFVARTHPLKENSIQTPETLENSTQLSPDQIRRGIEWLKLKLQDTFFLDGISDKKIANPEQIRKVSDSHKKNWRYQWDINEARKMVLRTHTTCVTIKHLAENKPDEARIFSLGRVFRNEKVSYKHLVEFNQIEGIVVGKDANLRNLMGIQREFYKRIGITKIKFWPTFFPYTEPSLQTMVYNEKLGKWIELFGMGIFRPEVTKPLGITKPVLAWGGGIERIAMLKYDLDDVREFYNNNLGWLRSNTKCQ